ncbi:MAG TPA: molybdopterin-dependent oxidoreductase [Thermoanaerobaculia bacterium]
MPPFDKRSGFLVRQESPFNAGPAPADLRANAITPNDLFFVRNHGDVPAVDPEAFRLTVDGLVERPLSLSLADLRRFASATVTATVQCAGNRRLELIAHEPIPGELGWGTEAVSTATWTGAPLADVLAAAGPKGDAKHVLFSGRDETERHGHRFTFGGSIPLGKAGGREVLLAYEMNGQPLPPVHGAPLRALVPGFIGARSVKWLSSLTLSATPSTNYFQAKAYRLFPQEVRAENVVWEDGLMLGEMCVNSVLTRPLDGEALPAGTVTVEGYAIAGGGRTVERVDLSLDGGTSWKQAELASVDSPWAWRLFRAALDLSPGSHEIVCRAWDSAAQTQPESVAHVWNFKGYMNNAWHRVRVTCS